MLRALQALRERILPSSGVNFKLLVPSSKDNSYLQKSMLDTDNQDLCEYLAPLKLSMLAKVEVPLCKESPAGFNWNWTPARKIMLEDGATYVVDDASLATDQQLQQLENFKRNAATANENELVAGLLQRAFVRGLTDPRLLAFKELRSLVDRTCKVEVDAGIVTKTCCLIAESKQTLDLDAVRQAYDNLQKLKVIVGEGVPAGAPLRGKPIFKFMYAKVLPRSEQLRRAIFQQLADYEIELWAATWAPKSAAALPCIPTTCSDEASRKLW